MDYTNSDERWHIQCPICDEDADIEVESEEYEEGTYRIYRCPHCGYVGYPQGETLKEYLLWEDKLPHHLLAGYLYENKNGLFLLNENNCKKIIDTNILPKNAIDFLDKICLNLYYLGYNFLRGIRVDCVFPALGYATDRFELRRMFKDLIRQGYIEIEPDEILGDEPETINYYCLTAEGIKRAEALLSLNNESTKVFIAMRFKEEMNKVRDRGIKPACKKCGFSAFTVNEEEYIGDVTDRILTGIKTSRFVIADFTENNLGVYYEAGYAKGLGIPVIKTCNKSWFDAVDKAGKNKLHFDIEHDNLILWENEKDLAKKLENRIRATIL